jgi:hypothetical protein
MEVPVIDECFVWGMQEALTATDGFGKYGIIRETDMYR